VRGLGVGRSEEDGGAGERCDEGKNAFHEHGESPRGFPARTFPGVGSRCRAGKDRESAPPTMAGGRAGSGSHVGERTQNRRAA
jgi:hypothetical protein